MVDPSKQTTTSRGILFPVISICMSNIRLQLHAESAMKCSKGKQQWSLKHAKLISISKKELGDWRYSSKCVWFVHTWKLIMKPSELATGSYSMSHLDRLQIVFHAITLLRKHQLYTYGMFEATISAQIDLVR